MELRVNLKVCEGCGCLWYRAQVETGVYCQSCDERFREFPAPRIKKSSGRPKKITLPTVFAVEAGVGGFAGMEAFGDEPGAAMGEMAGRGRRILPMRARLGRELGRGLGLVGWRSPAGRAGDGRAGDGRRVSAANAGGAL